MNVVTWQWAGYYMIIIYAALQGIDSSIYEAARIDGANAWQIAFRIKVPMVASALLLILVFALIGTLQFFTEPQILRPLANGTITAGLHAEHLRVQQAFALRQLQLRLGDLASRSASSSSSRSYVFLFFTRKRGSVFT